MFSRFTYAADCDDRLGGQVRACWGPSAYRLVSAKLLARLTQTLFNVTILIPPPTWFLHDGLGFYRPYQLLFFI